MSQYTGTEEQKRKNRERSAAWRLANPEKYRGYQAEYHRHLSEEEKKKKAENSRKWYRKNLKRAMVNSARMRAKRRNIDFTISKEDFEIPPTCPIYNIPLEVCDGGNSDNSPTLDRIDSSKGYVKGNVHVISRRANTHKSSASKKELQMLAEWAKRNMP